MQTVREMIPEYKRNLGALEQRRAELIQWRSHEPRAEIRERLTQRIMSLDAIVSSTAAALKVLLEYER